MALIPPVAVPDAAAFTPPGSATWSNGLVSIWRGDGLLGHHSFRAVAFDPNTDTIYAGTSPYVVVALNLSSGVAREVQLFAWLPAPGVSPPPVRALDFDPQAGILYAGSGSGVRALDVRSWQIRPVCGETVGSVWDLHRPVGTDRLYLATGGGLRICDLATGTTTLIDSAAGFPWGTVHAVRADPGRQRVYAGVYPGLSIYFETNGTVLNLNETHGLPSRFISSIDLGPYGVFLGTYGLSVLNATTLEITNYGRKEGLTYPHIDDVAYVSGADAVYLAANSDEIQIPERPIPSRIDVLYLDNLTVGHFTVQDGLPGGYVRDVAYDASSDLVMGAAERSFSGGGGLLVIDPLAPRVRDHTRRVAERGDPIPLAVNVTGSHAITSVIAEYLDVTGSTVESVLHPISGEAFEGTIPAQHVEGVVRYRIEAVDARGRVAVVPSFSEWFEIAVEDTRYPTLVDYGPTGTSVPLETEIVLTFSEPMNVTSVATALRVSPRVPMGVARGDGDTVRIPLSTLEYGIQYRIFLTSVATDPWGNPLDQDEDGIPRDAFFWSFSTVKRLVPPKLLVIAPSSASAGDVITIQAIVEGADGVAYVNLSYEDVNGERHEVPMALLGSRAGEEIWIAKIPAQSALGEVHYRVTAQDAAGGVAAYPPEGSLLIIIVAPTKGPQEDGAWLAFLAVLLTVGAAVFTFLGIRKHGRAPQQ